MLRLHLHLRVCVCVCFSHLKPSSSLWMGNLKTKQTNKKMSRSDSLSCYHWKWSLVTFLRLLTIGYLGTCLFETDLVISSPCQSQKCPDSHIQLYGYSKLKQRLYLKKNQRVNCCFDPWTYFFLEMGPFTCCQTSNSEFWLGARPTSLLWNGCIPQNCWSGGDCHAFFAEKVLFMLVLM